MAPAPIARVPATVPPNPSLAMLASLAAIALDAAMRNHPYNPDPVARLASVLNARLGGGAAADGSAKRLIDPETTDLLSTVLENDQPTVEELTQEGERIAAALESALSDQNPATLQQLRDFALRLSSAALSEASRNESVPTDPAITI